MWALYEEQMAASGVAEVASNGSYVYSTRFDPVILTLTVNILTVRCQQM